MYTIENDQLSVSINAKGAELQRIYSKDYQLEYMWSGDPAFWGKHSPILFPVVGTLKKDQYYFHDKAYQLSRHGFAREMEFSASNQNAASIVFTLESNEKTLANYPFAFRLDIVYELVQNILKVSYHVSNPGQSDLYFSVGGHPAFKCPLTEGTEYDDYYLEFNQAEEAGRWPISADGLIENKPVELLKKTNRLPLTKALFQKDALVFKGLASNHISLKSDETTHGLSMDFTGFPYLGIWAAKNADFVCIEPWCGIADSVNSDQQLVDKEGIETLAPGKIFERAWTVTIY